MPTAPTNDPPTNGPVIIEVPGYADRLIELISLIEHDRKAHHEAAKALESKRERLTEVLQAVIAAEGWDRVYDPLTGTCHHVGYADRRTKAVPLGISVDPCGNSTAIRLSEELKARVAEILSVAAERPKVEPADPTIPGRRDEELAIDGEAEEVPFPLRPRPVVTSTFESRRD